MFFSCKTLVKIISTKTRDFKYYSMLQHLYTLTYEHNTSCSHTYDTTYLEMKVYLRYQIMVICVFIFYLYIINFYYDNNT